VVLQRARFEATGIVFDPSIATVDRARLAAAGLVLAARHPDRVLRAARLAADFTDSTLTPPPMPSTSRRSPRRVGAPRPGAAQIGSASRWTACTGEGRLPRLPQ
jgi:hypothetical protein